MDEINVTNIVTLIAAITAAFVAIIGAIKNNRANSVQDVKTDKVIGKIDEVHSVTNRNFSEQKQRISDLEGLVKSLQDIQAVAETTRTVLASEAAAALAAQPSTTIVKP